MAAIGSRFQQIMLSTFFFFSSRRRHTRLTCDWSSDVCSSDLVDVGASAGLNLFCDRYRLDYGSAGATGPVGAPVRIECEVLGGDPPIAPAPPEIVERSGLDLDQIGRASGRERVEIWVGAGCSM